MMRKKKNGPRRKPSGGTQSSTHKVRPASLIVGIGASAGGLNAFTAFFPSMPPDSGMTFVLVQHLAPDHKSLLADLIGKVTAMPVMEAENDTAVAPNTVYVIPPDATLTFRQRSLQVSKPAPPRERRRPIDTFFSSLAEEQGENAVCIVLSGTGTDGTLGLKTIKEHGGLTLAQAEYDHTAMSGMPQSATATGLVDAVLPVEDMPAKLLDYQRHLLKVASKKDGDGTRSDAGEYLTRISSLLRARVGHDFSRYKDKTLVRRIQRRMQVLQIDTMPAYVDRLKEDPRQIDLLFRELLIGVTQFFRDPSAFAALATVAIPQLLERAEVDDHVRIWVPACATGEEVYSIAILVREALIGRETFPSIQIFGTDIDENAVAFARSARYRKTTGLSPERLARWFAEDGDEHCPIKTIREMCVFSTHSVVKDPPFSKLGLISCRNLLIYMDADLQDRVLRTFHYALRPDGILFLGPAEGTSRQSRLFDSLDKKHRIFRRGAADVTLPELSAPAGSVLRHPGHSAATTAGIDGVERRAKRIADKYSPVHLVIDRNHQIIRFSGGAVGHYLEPSTGTPSFNLFDILRNALRPVVRSALEEAIARKGPVTRDDVRLRIDGQSRSVTVVVEPMSDARNADEWLCVVVFQHALGNPGQQAAGDSPAGEADRGSLGALQSELLTTRAQLQSALDDLETANEEMKSAGEEYQSINEELQSSNEELETSKEEMQSINEELQTVNMELAGKNDALTRLNNDLKNLLDSTQIATIFLDNDLRIKNFTPGMVDILRLRDTDRGRPVTDIATALSYAELSDDARTVLRDLSVIEREVELRDNHTTFLMRIRPYRTLDNMIGGVVITFVDVSVQRRSNNQRIVLLQELNHRVKNTLATVQAIALQTFRYTDTREAFRDTFLDRLMALSKTHNLLTASNWEGASLRKVLLSELAPYQADNPPRFAIEGEDTQLDAPLTLALGLALHELATNAVKHGALSVPAGRVAIQWEIDAGEGRLRLRWIETGGPRVEEPARRGMGLRMIESGLMHEVGGGSRIDFNPSGVQCVIEIPTTRRKEGS